MVGDRTLVSAKYEGENGPHGYEKGNTYTVYVYQMTNNMVVVYSSDTAIEKKMCGYENLAKYLKNWSEISALGL